MPVHWGGEKNGGVHCGIAPVHQWVAQSAWDGVEDGLPQPRSLKAWHMFQCCFVDVPHLAQLVCSCLLRAVPTRIAFAPLPPVGCPCWRGARPGLQTGLQRLLASASPTGWSWCTPLLRRHSGHTSGHVWGVTRSVVMCGRGLWRVCGRAAAAWFRC